MPRTPGSNVEESSALTKDLSAALVEDDVLADPREARPSSTTWFVGCATPTPPSASTCSVPKRAATTARTATTTCWSSSPTMPARRRAEASSATRPYGAPGSPLTSSFAHTATSRPGRTCGAPCLEPCFARGACFMPPDPARAEGPEHGSTRPRAHRLPRFRSSGTGRPSSPGVQRCTPCAASAPAPQR